MSVRVMSQVWEVDLPPMEKLVLLALADAANDEGHCWPSAATIVRKSGQGERTVRRCIQSLIDKGHLTQQQRPGTSAVYRLHPCQSGTPARAAPLPHRPETPARAAPNPLGTIKGSEASASSPKRARAKFPIPEGVTAEQWQAFREQRKKPLNARSYTLLTNKLRKLAEHGYPPGDMIDRAIERGWETVFEPRERTNGTPQPVGSLRGTRPDPALDLYRAACAAEEAEREDRPPDRRAWPALPAHGASRP